MSLSDDDFTCICSHPTICTCAFELDWMRQLVAPIYDEGYKHGFDDGVEQAITNTIYRGHTVCNHLKDHEIPWHVVDPQCYQLAYHRGYIAAYDQTHKRHTRVLEELQYVHTMRKELKQVLEQYLTHALLDYDNLFFEIEKYLWTALKKIRKQSRDDSVLR